MTTRWVRSHWDDEDVTFLWEVGDDGWVQRTVEFIGPDRRVRAAAALSEVIHARDTGGIEAVQAYEAQYGVVPEKPVDGSTFSYEDISQADFERAWNESRGVLDA